MEWNQQWCVCVCGVVWNGMMVSNGMVWNNDGCELWWVVSMMVMCGGDV